jgi:nitrite reductase/ring-hydroxylating ferredoxin subunit
MLSSRTFTRASFGLRLFRQATSEVQPRDQTTRAFTTTSRIMAQEEYRLKGISSLDLKPGEKREVEVEGIEEGKVLLCNVGGRVTAIGSKCTHYGAPLIKGVLTGDGRITCPWHGGKFIAFQLTLMVEAHFKYSLL